MKSADENAKGKCRLPRGDVVRRSDRWLAGLMLFLIAMVLVACTIGWTAISRQNRATCYQLVSVEGARAAEEKLARSDDPQNRQTHLDRAAGLKIYAAGLRAIVPGCPHPPRPRRPQ